MKLSEIEDLTLLDCSHAARDLFNTLPRLTAAQQASLIDYAEMRIAMWRKENAQQNDSPPEAQARDES